MVPPRRTDTHRGSRTELRSARPKVTATPKKFFLLSFASFLSFSHFGEKERKEGFSRQICRNQINRKRQRKVTEGESVI